MAVPAISFRGASPWWFLLAAPWMLVRLADLQFIYLRSFVFEVVLLFSLAFLLLQTLSSSDGVLLFEKATDNATPWDRVASVFLRFVSAATIGASGRAG